MVDVFGDVFCVILVFYGVVYGFLFHEPSRYIYVVSYYWDIVDELVCFWVDEEFGIDWLFEPMLVFEWDVLVQSLEDFFNEIELY